MKITVYIPAPASSLEAQLERGSAILATGQERSDGYRPVHCEGQVYGETLKNSFCDRVERGLQRMKDVGSTGRRLVRSEELVPVGIFNDRAGTLEIEYVQQANLLAQWLGERALDPNELRTTRAVIDELRRDLDTSAEPMSLREQRPAAAGREAARGPGWYSGSSRRLAG